MAKASYTYSNYLNSIKGIEKSLSHSAQPTIFIAWGPCDFLLLKSAQTLSAVWKNHSQSSPLRHEGSTLTADTLPTLFEQSGLFAERSLHIVKRAEKAKDIAGKITKLGKLNPGNHILFSLETNKQPTKLFKALQKLNPVEIPCFPPKSRDMQTFMFNLYKEFQVNVEQKATHLILQSLGEDLFGLSNAVSKLSLEFSGQEKPITYNQIAASIGVMREDHAFKLTDYILQSKRASAQILVEDLLSRGTEPLSILGIIARHIRNAVQLSGPNASANFLPQFVKKQYAGYLRKTSNQNLRNALICCHKIDLSLKSNQKTSPGAMLCQLISMI